MSDQNLREPVAMEEGADLLRFSTCGSVDDGKSTLIGRLLYESKLVYEDQLAALEAGAASSETLRTGVAELREVLQLVQALGVPESAYCLNFSIARGLDYYTKTAFEVLSGDIGAQSAILGGGRYDLLVKPLGGPDVPAFGWAIGLEKNPADPSLEITSIYEKLEKQILPAYYDRRQTYVSVMRAATVLVSIMAQCSLRRHHL